MYILYTNIKLFVFPTRKHIIDCEKHTFSKFNPHICNDLHCDLFIVNENANLIENYLSKYSFEVQFCNDKRKPVYYRDSG